MEGPAERSELECVTEAILASIATWVFVLLGMYVFVLPVTFVHAVIDFFVAGEIERLDRSPVVAALLLAGGLLGALCGGRFLTRSWRRAPRALAVVAFATVTAAGTAFSPVPLAAERALLAGAAATLLGGIGFLRPPRTGWA